MENNNTLGKNESAVYTSNDLSNWIALAIRCSRGK